MENSINKKIEIFNMMDEDILYIKEHILEFDDFWTEKMLEEEYNNSISSGFIAKNEKDKIVGFAFLWEPPYEIHISNIVVKKNMRNNKIGSKILEKLIDISKQKNKKELTLEVNVNNNYAIKLYEKYNFEKVGIRKAYYNNIDDALIMTKKLI